MAKIYAPSRMSRGDIMHLLGFALKGHLSCYLVAGKNGAAHKYCAAERLSGYRYYLLENGAVYKSGDRAIFRGKNLQPALLLPVLILFNPIIFTHLDYLFKMFPAGFNYFYLLRINLFLLNIRGQPVA